MRAFLALLLAAGCGATTPIPSRIVPDPSFGSDGVAELGLTGFVAPWQSWRRDPATGEISVVVSSLTANAGIPGGSGGLVAIASFKPDGTAEGAPIMIPQPTNRGAFFDASGNVLVFDGTMLTRLTSTGSADPSFQAVPLDVLSDALPTPDGKLWVFSQHSSEIRRYDSAGRPDATFGTSGVVGQLAANATAIPVAAVASSGVAVGLQTSGGPFEVAMVRDDGTIDPSFGQGGAAAVPFTQPVASLLGLWVDPSGLPFVEGIQSSSSAPGSTGSLLLDHFGQDGSVAATLDYPYVTCSITQLAFTPGDSQVLASGQYVAPHAPSTPANLPQFYLALYNADGSIASQSDPGVDLTTGSVDMAFALGDGKYLALGTDQSALILPADGDGFSDNLALEIAQYVTER